MAYLGNSPVLSQQEYRNIDNISGSFNGVTTSFPLLVNGVAPVPAPQSSNQCLISVNGVVQKPDDTGASGFRLSGGNIVFSAAPTGGQSFFGVILAGADYVYSGSNFPDGTVSAPSITFAQDLDTGFYRSGAGEVKFTANGANVVTLSANNLTAPSFIPTSSTVPTNGVYLPSANNVAISTNGQGRLFVDASGNVGAGTSSPTFSAGGGVQAKYATFSAFRATVGANTGTDFAASSDGTGYVYVRDNAGLIFGTSNTERMRLDSSGRLGLGTSSVGNALHIVTSSTTATARGITLSNTNASTANGMAEIDFYTDQYDGSTLNNKARITASLDASSPTAGYLAFSTRKSGVMTEAVRIDSQSRVGIGSTSDPGSIGSRLWIDSSTDTYYTINTTGSSNLTGIHFRNSNGNGEARILNNTGGALTFYRSPGNEAARIDSSGNLLVGATSGPAGYSGNIILGTNSGGFYFNGSTAGTFGTSSNQAMVLATNAAERARIDTSGRLLVGTSSAGGNELLQIQGVSGSSAAPGGLALKRSSVGNTDDIGFINFQNGSGNTFSQIKAFCDGTPGASDYPGALTFSTTADGASSPTERMRIDNTGNVYLKVMQVGGTANVHWSSSAGQLFVTSSSERFKHDIVDYDKGLDELMQMQPKYFVYNDEPNQKQRAGFIAEDFHDLGLTEYVEYWNDDEGNATVPSEIGYANMVAILVKSIQQQQTMIAELQTKVAALEAA
jgi:hypothetical protein